MIYKFYVVVANVTEVAVLIGAALALIAAAGAVL